MTAGLATTTYLRRNKSAVYGGLEQAGRRLRAGVDGALASAGVGAHTTGMGSLFMTHFGRSPTNAEETAAEDKELMKAYAMHLLANGVFMLPGHAGAVSTAHTRGDIERLVAVSGRFKEPRRK